MKELSIEQKAKRYDKALERAKKEWLNNLDGAYKNYRERLEFIFPELKNNKKEWIEKIRQELKSYLEHREVKQISESDAIDQWIAWLEKQGKQKSTGHNENEEPQVYETNDGDVVTYSETNGYKVIEPKFKVGDWISNDMCDVHIASIENGMYYFDEGDGLSIVFVDEHYHIWTIEDAIDGDVLAGNYGTFILMDKSKGGYCGVLNNNTFIKYTGNNEWTEDLHPATKEQRDILFQKMKEAGWEVDFEKKELKKIEVELTDFEKSLKHIMIETLECGDTRNLKADAEMLLRLAQNPTKWSEEDERNIQNIDAVLFYDRKLPEDTCVKLRNFLKTLKQRCI